MRLVSIDIKNFRVIKEASISFPDQVIGIIGPNGAGKSSIIEAIAWALYGNVAARTGKEGIRSTFSKEADCRVNLTFVIGEEQYRIERIITGRSDRAEATLFRGDKTESVGVAETGKYLQQLIGLDWRGFLSSFLARQQELNALSDLAPAKRRDHLAGMLGIERLDRAIQKVKDDNREQKAKAEYIENNLGNRESIENQIKVLNSQIADLKASLQKSETEFQAAKLSLEEIAEKLKLSQKAASDWQRINGLLLSEQQTKTNLEKKLIELKDERKTLFEYSEKIKSLEEILKELPEKQSQLEKLKQIQISEKRKHNLTDNLKRQQTEIDKLSGKLSSLEVKADKLKNDLKAFPDDLSERMLAAKESLLKAREEFSSVKTTVAQKEAELELAIKRLRSLSELGPESVCDRCHRPLGDDLDEIRSHFETELKEAKAHFEAAQQSLGKIEEEGKGLGQYTSHLEKEIKSRDDLIRDLGVSEKEIEGIRGQHRLISDNIKLTEKELKGLPLEKFDLSVFEAIQEELTKLDGKKTEHDRLMGRVERLPKVEDSIIETDKLLAGLNPKIEKLTIELAELDYDQNNHKKLEEDNAVFQKRVDDSRDALTRSKSDLSKAESDLAFQVNQLKDFEKSKEHLESFKHAQYHGEKLAGLFDLFRKHLIARIRPTLAELSSRLVGEMTDQRYSLVELDEQYNLSLMDNGQFYEVERFSGGEKDLANLCLRLAISQALTEAAGLSSSFVILDEVFGSQDSDRRALIIDSLSQLKKSFPQILLITHIEEIKDRVEQLIEVKPNPGGYSEVFVQSNYA